MMALQPTSGRPDSCCLSMHINKSARAELFYRMRHTQPLKEALSCAGIIMQAQLLVNSAKADAASKLALLRDLEARMAAEPPPPVKPTRVPSRRHQIVHRGMYSKPMQLCQEMWHSENGHGCRSLAIAAPDCSDKQLYEADALA